MERKRVLAGNAHQSKRARCQSSQQLSETYSKIDSIPSRSNPHFTIDGTLVAAGERPRPTVISHVASSSGLNWSFTSSTSNGTSTSSTSSITSSRASSSTSTTIVSSNSSFSTAGSSSFVSSKNTSFSTDLAPSPEESCSDYHTSQEWLTDSDLDSDPRLSSHVWEKRLKGVFPKFGNDDFSNAPLPVVWDITRYALYCGVKLDEIEIPYGDAKRWLHQSTLRQLLLQQEAFQGKHLPEPTSQKDWNIALDPSQSQHGAIRYSGELVPNQDAEGPLFILKLNPLHTQSSHRLTRRFGSDRFLEISMPSMSDVKKFTSCTDDAIAEWWIKGDHYFLGRQWSAFYCKKDDAKTKKRKGGGGAGSGGGGGGGGGSQAFSWYTFTLFACNGDIFRASPDGSLPPLEDAVVLDRRLRVNLCQMISWAIGDLKTTNQQVAKLFSRISLNLTNTTATVVLEKHQIYHCPEDIGKFPMNDGIGRISPSLARRIAAYLGLEDTPCVFQARFGSAKGMWVVDALYRPPNIDDKEEDWIVTYPSQRKWDCKYEDAHHCTLEVHSWPKEVKPASLNQQFILLLEAQATNPKLMRELLAKYLRERLQADLDELKNAMDHPLDLLYWLQRVGGSRSDTGGSQDEQQAALGGLPKRKEEQVACLVDAGFLPSQCQFLQDICRDLGHQMAETLKTKMNIQVPCSAYLSMIVDFSSVLEEDEVHVSFSNKFHVEGFSDTLLEDMDILVGRAPAHLPSDIQRVRVVSHPRLRHLKDVIVFSIKGERPLADKLSGGDYDGDKAWVCWDQAIVRNFRNAPEDSAKYAEAPKLAKFNLSMSQVREEAVTEAEVCERLLYEGIMFNMQPSLLGRCTKYKEDYCRKIGSVSNPIIITMSLLLSLLVDQSKQGHIFTDEDWLALLKGWGLPRYLSDMSASAGARTGVVGRLGKKRDGVVYVLDYLQSVAEQTVVATLTDLNRYFKGNPAQWYDADLTSKFNAYDKEYSSVTEWIQLRQKLRADIDYLGEQWFARHRAPDSANDSFIDSIKEFYDRWQKIQPLEALRQSKFIQMLLWNGTKNLHSSTWELLKASCAMTRLKGAGGRLVWYVAGWQLCRLKQDMSDVRYAGVLPELYSARRVDKKIVARRRARRGGDEDGLSGDGVSDGEDGEDG
ncbi:hypothetical protein E4U21_001986 [Claviceps maximensis]|nr:hypothetical protein E4U21_001986 [Claviceps maximensis]